MTLLALALAIQFFGNATTTADIEATNPATARLCGSLSTIARALGENTTMDYHLASELRRVQIVAEQKLVSTAAQPFGSLSQTASNYDERIHQNDTVAGDVLAEMTRDCHGYVGK